MNESQLIIELQDKIKQLQLDLQYEIHQKSEIEKKYNDLQIEHAIFKEKTS